MPPLHCSCSLHQCVHYNSEVEAEHFVTQYYYYYSLTLKSSSLEVVVAHHVWEVVAHFLGSEAEVAVVVLLCLVTLEAATADSDPPAVGEEVHLMTIVRRVEWNREVAEVDRADLRLKM